MEEGAEGAPDRPELGRTVHFRRVISARDAPCCRWTSRANTSGKGEFPDVSPPGDLATSPGPQIVPLLPVYGLTMSVVEQYWAGVLQRLRTEVDVFAKLVQHMGERGRLNELALSRLLEGFVPERIGVGTGVLFDTRDRQSPQTDVVLFDRANQPAVMAQTTQVMFPIEVATACVEVKTTLTSGDIADCLKKRRRLHDLEPLSGEGLPSGHPPFVVLSYDAGLSSAQATVDSFGRDVEHLPDLLCVLDVGLVAARSEVLKDGATNGWICGLALVQVADGGESWDYLVTDPKDERVDVGGQMVAVVEHNGAHYAADPGRALLLFADALARMAADRVGAPAPVLGHYLTDRVRALADLKSPIV